MSDAKRHQARNGQGRDESRKGMSRREFAATIGSSTAAVLVPLSLLEGIRSKEGEPLVVPTSPRSKLLCKQGGCFCDCICDCTSHKGGADNAQSPAVTTSYGDQNADALVT